jgi:ATP sulfurylase
MIDSCSDPFLFSEIYVLGKGLKTVWTTPPTSLPRLDRNVKRGGTRIRGMGREGQNPHRELLRPEDKPVGMGRVVIPEGK